MLKKIFEQCFFLFYYLLVLFVYLISLPYLFFLSFKKKYKESIPARFFLYKNKFFNENNIWFHSCSLGETKSLKPIIDKINKEVNISVTTNTGYEEAKKLSNSVRFLPFEIWQPFWQKKQQVLIVLEAELWYLLFFIAKRKGTKTILLNARISDNSYKAYKKFSFFYKIIFKYIDEIFAQSDIDKQRLKEIGAKNIKVIGNIKAYNDIKITKKMIKPINTKIITLASTHEGEEELILKTIRFEKNMKIIIVPRHPERFDKVNNFLENFSKKNSLTYGKMSENESISSNIVLCDKMGELVNIFAISDIVLLCGSFVKGIGGHNPLEPAYFGCSIISGKYIFNQKVLFDMVKNIYISDIDNLNNLLSSKLKKSYIKEKVDLDPLFKSIGEKHVV